MNNTKREVSLRRSQELKLKISNYLQAKKNIQKGLENEEKILYRKAKILEKFKGNNSDWDNYQWQLKNRIKDAETLSKFLNLDEEEIDYIKKVEKEFRWAISPYYLSLLEEDNKLDPIKLMSVPTKLELEDDANNLDPMAEEYTNPAGSITRRYPDRLIINVTNECAMYCRHCQRRRNIGQTDNIKSKAIITESIDYIRENSEIRDVLITGGDPLTLPDSLLEWILESLTKIPHVEYIRIGTRTLVTMPQRITNKLCEMLSKYHPLYINTQFNHPMEITKEAKKACEKLASYGIPLGNQAVLLNGINNNKYVMRCLNQELLKLRIKPYYLFHAKTVKGTAHFKTSIDDGIEIMEYLRGYTSGMAIPTYIVNAPKGQGKTPILPQYLISRGKNSFTIRTWEGKIVKCENRETKDISSLL